VVDNQATSNPAIFHEKRRIKTESLSLSLSFSNQGDLESTATEDFSRARVQFRFKLTWLAKNVWREPLRNRLPKVPKAMSIS